MGQEVSQRGFAQARGTGYPQEAINDATRLLGDALFREEASWRPAAWLTLAGAFDARADTHDRVERRWSIDWSDRGRRRPALSARRLSVAARHRGLTVEAGKQFVRWGRADILNPTDRFASRDFMEVVDNDFLAVTAVRVTWEHGPDTIDLVWAPRFTPSRIPLLAQRWGVTPAPSAVALSQQPRASVPASTPGQAGHGFGGLPVVEADAVFPSRSQFGLRWSRVGSAFEFSLSAFDGFNHLPRFDLQIVEPAKTPAEAASEQLLLQVRPGYSRMRMFGGDAALPNRWFTVKGEAAYFTSTDPGADEYGTYVLQVERQQGEWFFVGGYAGEFVTRRGEALSFAPDRGLANTFLGRASYSIDVMRSIAFEGAVRRSGDGVWLKAEYSQAVGQHWRATVRGNLIRGKASDFLGQYRSNSNLDLVLRYSF